MRFRLKLAGCAAALAALSLGLVATIAQAQPGTVVQARAYGANIVRRMNDTGPNTWTAGNNSGELFPDLSVLLSDNGRLAGANYGGPDYEGDAVCQCQEGGKRYTLTDVVQIPDGYGLRVRADSSFANGTHETQRYTVVVRAWRGRMRVYDVVTSEGSTRSMLVRHNACLRASHDAAAIDRCFGRH
jgi:hypothetical protein